MISLFTQLIEEYKHLLCGFFFINAGGGDTYPVGFRGEGDNLGKFGRIDLCGVPSANACRACDCECFRDPSELLDPLIALGSQPSSLARRLLSEGENFRLCFDDVGYVQTRAFFDRRTAFHL